MVKLTPCKNLSIEDNCDEDENQGVIYVATIFDADARPPKYDRSAYGEHVSLDDHFLIDVRCRCTHYNTDVLKDNYLANQGNNNEDDDEDNDDEDNEDDEEEFEDDEDDDDDDYGPGSETTDVIDKSFQRPVQGFPTNYEQAWHVVYRWLTEELDTVPDFVLPLLTEELTHWALYLLDQMPNRKKLNIYLNGVIYEKLLFRSVPVDAGINWFVTEVGVWEKVEPLDDKKEETDEEFVINVYSEYRPIGSEGSICNTHKCSHPAHELWGLPNCVFTDIVSMMLKQVDLPGELPYLCLLKEIIREAKSLILDIVDDTPRKTLELNAVIRITEALHPTPKYSGDVEFSRLSLPSNLLLKPLLSCHL